MEVASEGTNSGISAQAAGIDWDISLEPDSKVNMPSWSVSEDFLWLLLQREEKYCVCL